MRWIVPLFFLSIVTSAAESGEYQVGFRHRSAPPVGYGIMAIPQVQVITPQVQVQVVPVQPVLQVPRAITVTPMVPQTTLRWGFFRKRLIPRTTYVPTSPIQYQLKSSQ